MPSRTNPGLLQSENRSLSKGKGLSETPVVSFPIVFPLPRQGQGYLDLSRSGFGSLLPFHKPLESICFSVLVCIFVGIKQTLTKPTLQRMPVWQAANDKRNDATLTSLHASFCGACSCSSLPSHNPPQLPTKKKNKKLKTHKKMKHSKILASKTKQNTNTNMPIVGKSYVKHSA